MNCVLLTCWVRWWSRPKGDLIALSNLIRKKSRIRNRSTTIKLHAKRNRKTKTKTQTTTNTITTNKAKLSFVFVNSQGSFFSCDESVIFRAFVFMWVLFSFRGSIRSRKDSMSNHILHYVRPFHMRPYGDRPISLKTDFWMQKLHKPVFKQNMIFFRTHLSFSRVWFSAQ